MPFSISVFSTIVSPTSVGKDMEGKEGHHVCTCIVPAIEGCGYSSSLATLHASILHVGFLS